MEFCIICAAQRNVYFWNPFVKRIQESELTLLNAWVAEPEPLKVLRPTCCQSRSAYMEINLPSRSVTTKQLFNIYLSTGYYRS